MRVRACEYKVEEVEEEEVEEENYGLLRWKGTREIRKKKDDEDLLLRVLEGGRSGWRKVEEVTEGGLGR